MMADRRPSAADGVDGAARPVSTANSDSTADGADGAARSVSAANSDSIVDGADRPARPVSAANSDSTADGTDRAARPVSAANSNGTATARRAEGQERPERRINRFVMLQSVILMLVRALGFLAPAWSTVALLGGYVSDLETKDFWWITAISLFLASKIFNALVDEQYSYMVDLLCDAIPELGKKVCGKIIARDRLPIQREEVTSGLELIPLILTVLHILLVIGSITGPIIRLREGVYGEKPNLRQAMMIFYLLSVVQGMLYLLWLILIILGELLVKDVSSNCEFDPSWGYKCVRRYHTETWLKCAKDLSATRDRNLITYASELMDSDHKEDYISGARMLVVFIEKQQLLDKALIRSSRKRIQKLILMLAWTDNKDLEIRLLAAKIVEHIAGDISLSQFPGALDCLCSLLKVSDGHPIFRPPPVARVTTERTVLFQLLRGGFCILENLCRDELNCIEICGSRLLVKHILAWAFCKPVLKREETEWTTIVTSSFNLLGSLASIHHHFSEVVRKDIVFELFPSCLSGYKNHPEVLETAIYTFSHAYSMEEFPDDKSRLKRKVLVMSLLELFIDEIKTAVSDGLEKAREEAGKALLRLSKFKDNCVAVIMVERDIFDKLSKIIDSSDVAVHHKAIAAGILMRLINQCPGNKPGGGQGTENQANNKKEIPGAVLGDGEQPENDKETHDEVLLKAMGKRPKRLRKVLEQLYSSIDGEAGMSGPASTNDNFSDECFDSKKLQANLLRIIYIMLPSLKNEKRKEILNPSSTSTTITFLERVRKLVQANRTAPGANPLEILKLAVVLAEQMITLNIDQDSNRWLQIFTSVTEASSGATSNVDSFILYDGTLADRTVYATTLSKLVHAIRKYNPKDGAS